jgi:hypothetical protein
MCIHVAYFFILWMVGSRCEICQGLFVTNELTAFKAIEKEYIYIFKPYNNEKKT